VYSVWSYIFSFLVIKKQLHLCPIYLKHQRIQVNVILFRDIQTSSCNLTFDNVSQRNNLQQRRGQLHGAEKPVPGLVAYRWLWELAWAMLQWECTQYAINETWPWPTAQRNRIHGGGRKGRGERINGAETDHHRIRMAEGHYRSSESKRMTEREREIKD